MLYDYLYVFDTYKEEKMVQSLKRMNLDLDTYLHLSSPAVEWLLKCIAVDAPKSIFTTVLKHFRDFCGNSMVLKHIIDSFDPTLYAVNAAAMVALVKQADASRTTTVEIFHTMATRFMQAPPPEEQRMVILNEVWKVVAKVRVGLSEQQIRVFTNLVIPFYSVGICNRT